MKKISEDLKTCNKYKPDESSEEYKDRVLKLIASMPGKSDNTIKYLKESFDLKLFEKLLNQKHTSRGGIIQSPVKIRTIHQVRA